MAEFTKPNEKVPNNTTDRRSKNFNEVWKSRIVDKSNRQLELTNLPEDLKRVAEDNFAEKNQWRISIFVGESPTKSFIDDPYIPSLRRQKEDKISEHINLFNLPKHGR
jgi:hypothetical protein